MTTQRTTLLGLAFTLLMLAPATESLAASTVASRPRCQRIFVRSPEAKSNKKKPKFSATEIMDIQFQALISRKLSGQHSLEFKVYTPKGNLYQSMTLRFDADAAVPEDATRRERKFQSIDAVLPVAGTSIVSSSMYGTWKVEAFLNGDDRRCSRPRRFVIKP